MQKKGIRDLVIADGTEMKSGMISGGNHKNIFNLNLGTKHFDKQITKLIDSINKLENHVHNSNSEFE